MVQKFIEEATDCVTAIEQALEVEDLAQLQETAHGLKGIARNMGADALARMVYELEQWHSYKSDRDPLLLNKIHQEFQRVQAALLQKPS